MKYLLQLQPLGPFFFGSDRTFSYRGDFGLSDSYIVKSTRWPQQTHLLGMIRRVLLEINGLLNLRPHGWGIDPDDQAKAKIMIGDNNASAPSQLGKIKHISPVFMISLQNNQPADFHFSLPMDAGLNFSPKIEPACKVSIADVKTRQPVMFANYEAKKGVKQGLTTGQFWSDYLKANAICDDDILKFDDVWLKVWQIGVKRKNRTVKEDEDGSLYKKCSYLLQSDPQKGTAFRFGCILELYDDLFGAEFERQIYLGAERSTFNMIITPYKKEYDAFMPRSCDKHTKAVVLGELFDCENLFNPDHFVLNTECTPFGRIIPSNTSECDRYRTTKSEQLNVLPKGSVIFFLNSPPNEIPIKNNFYTNIGYNHLIYV